MPHDNLWPSTYPVLSYEAALVDLTNMRYLADPQWHILLVDDTNCNADWRVDTVITEMLKRGEVIRVQGFSLGNGREISVLHYVF